MFRYGRDILRCVRASRGDRRLCGIQATDVNCEASSAWRRALLYDQPFTALEDYRYTKAFIQLFSDCMETHEQVGQNVAGVEPSGGDRVRGPMQKLLQLELELAMIDSLRPTM